MYLVVITHKLCRKMCAMFFTVCRKEYFNAAHRLHNPKWSDEKNKATFGLCNNPNYHGHNYTLVVQLSGPQNPETGYVYDMKRLSVLIQKEVITRYDHRNLNLDVDEFKHCPPSTENLAHAIYERLRPHITAQYQLSILLYETKNNYVKYSPEG